jgi:dihydrofolate reductase/thymidylate synthase
MKKFNIILASDNNNGIGRNNELPWHFKKDLKFFKNITSYNEYSNKNVLIMGNNTFKSINCSLILDRIIYVITFDKSYTKNYNNILYFNSFIDAYNEASKNINGNIWVIGGSMIFNIAINHYACNKIYYTYIDNDFNCDTFFNINNYNINWIYNTDIKDINILNSKEYDLTFKKGKIIHNIENQYLKLLYNVSNLKIKNSRNGNIYSKFNHILTHDFKYGFPILTTKKMFWKGIVEELLFFIRGDTDTNILLKQGITIWKENTSKDFLKSVNLNYDEGIMGPMYGYQLRFFNKPYINNIDKTYIDQLQYIINEIINNPTSRRIIMTTFNPEQVNLGVLYPCHSIIIQFYVNNEYLSCNMYQRSADLFLGLPFNISSTALLLLLVAKLTNKISDKMNIIIGDAHIYVQHINQVYQLLDRIPYKFPTLDIPNFSILNEIENSNYNDYVLNNYNYHPILKADFIA